MKVLNNIAEIEESCSNKSNWPPDEKYVIPNISDEVQITSNQPNYKKKNLLRKGKNRLQTQA